MALKQGIWTAALAGLCLSAANGAHAQDTSEKSVYDGDYLTIGAGGAYGPSYEGSDDYVFFPVAAIQGRVAGVEINPRPGGLALRSEEHTSELQSH